MLSLNHLLDLNRDLKDLFKTKKGEISGIYNCISQLLKNMLNYNINNVQPINDIDILYKNCILYNEKSDLIYTLFTKVTNSSE